MDGQNVRMIQGGDQLRFALEALTARTIIEISRDKLDRDRSVEPRVDRAIDLPHASGADGGQHLVGAALATGQVDEICYGTTGIQY